MEETLISDMYFAAALLAYGVPFQGVDKKDPKRQKFKFGTNFQSVIVNGEDDVLVRTVENPSLEDIQNFFIARTLWLPPSYPDSVRIIKSAIHSQ